MLAMLLLVVVVRMLDGWFCEQFPIFITILSVLTICQQFPRNSFFRQVASGNYFPSIVCVRVLVVNGGVVAAMPAKRP